MSSIDSLLPALRPLADPLFDALLAAGAPDAVRFPLAPDAALPSYYVQRRQVSMTRADFLAPSCLDGAEFADRLGAYWQGAGQPALAALAPLLAASARDMHALYVAARPRAALSPYVYQMF
jgi:hypothetical protein